MANGTKYTTKQQLLDAIQSLVYENDNNETTSDNIQKAAKDIVESIWTDNTQNKIFSVSNPTTSVKTIMHTTKEIEIASIIGAVTGNTSPAVSIDISYGPARNNTPTSLISGAPAIIDSLAQESITLISNKIVPANSWICVDIIGTSGTVTEFVLSLEYSLTNN